MSAEDLVRRFCAEWPGLSPAGIAEFFTPDCVYRHVALDRPLVSARTIAGAIEIYRARFDQVESAVVRLGSDGDVVLCERADRFWLPSGRMIEVRAMSAFDVRGGRIAVWNDYFDVAALKRQVDLTEG